MSVSQGFHNHTRIDTSVWNRSAVLLGVSVSMSECLCVSNSVNLGVCGFMSDCLSECWSS